GTDHIWIRRRAVRSGLRRRMADLATVEHRDHALHTLANSDSRLSPPESGHHPPREDFGLRFAVKALAERTGDANQDIALRRPQQQGAARFRTVHAPGLQDAVGKGLEFLARRLPHEQYRKLSPGRDLVSG